MNITALSWLRRGLQGDGTSVSRDGTLSIKTSDLRQSAAFKSQSLAAKQISLHLRQRADAPTGRRATDKEK